MKCTTLTFDLEGNKIDSLGENVKSTSLPFVGNPVKVKRLVFCGISD